MSGKSVLLARKGKWKMVLKNTKFVFLAVCVFRVIIQKGIIGWKYRNTNLYFWVFKNTVFLSFLMRERDRTVNVP
jgi:hypothetical protein